MTEVGGKVIHFNFRKTVWIVTLPGDLLFLVLARHADPIDEGVPKVDPATHEEERYLRASGMPVHEA